MAQAFQIAGFALMSPAGRIFIDPFPIFKEVEFHLQIIYISIALILFFAGFIFIVLGRDILGE